MLRSKSLLDFFPTWISVRRVLRVKLVRYLPPVPPVEVNAMTRGVAAEKRDVRVQIHEGVLSVAVALDMNQVVAHPDAANEDQDVSGAGPAMTLRVEMLARPRSLVQLVQAPADLGQKSVVFARALRP